MIRLSREIRFALIENFRSEISNSWSGWPSTSRIVPQLCWNCTVEGVPDEQTGYLVNIKEIDDLVRQVIARVIIPEFRPGQHAEKLLRQIDSQCRARWKPPGESPVGIVEQTLALNPRLRFTIRSENARMIRLTQQFEFSAAHRLHCHEFSNQENKKLFGKCNNPAGHGHNYVVEISIDRDDDPPGQVFDLHGFESTVKKRVIDRLDHKHLNEDVEYFAAINPSVENIAIAIWTWLAGHLGDAELANVRVYETPKTWADYCGRR